MVITIQGTEGEGKTMLAKKYANVRNHFLQKKAPCIQNFGLAK